MASEFFPTPRDEEHSDSHVEKMTDIVSDNINISDIKKNDTERVTPDSFSRPEKEDNEEKPGGWRKVIDIVATGLSWILVPLNMPVFGLWLLFGLSILSVLPSGFKWEITGIVFGLNVIIPMIVVYLLKWFGLVDDLGLNGRRERLIPYILSVIILGFTGYWCAHFGFPLWITGFYYGGAIAAIINLIVNFAWKISAHAAAMAGVLALLVRLWIHGENYGPVEIWLIVWILLTGLLGASRIWLGRHTPMQVFCGTAVGFLAVYLCMGVL